MKRFLGFIVICFLVVNTFSFDSQAEEDESAGWDVPGVYPIDVNEVLLKKYDDLQVDYEIIADRDANVSNRFAISGYWQELFLQCYFSTVIGDLSENEKVILKDILEEKYNEKVGICEHILTTTYLTPDNAYFSTINSICPYNRKHERRDCDGGTDDGQGQSRRKAMQ